MPFRSKAQIAKFRSLVAEGRITQEMFDEWMRATEEPEQLPVRLKEGSGMIALGKAAGIVNARIPLAPHAPKTTPLGVSRNMVAVPEGMARRGMLRKHDLGLSAANLTAPGLATGKPRGLI